MFFYTMNPAHKQGSVSLAMPSQEVKPEVKGEIKQEMKEEALSGDEGVGSVATNNWEQEDYGFCYCT